MSILMSLKHKWSRLRDVFVPNLLFLFGRGPKRLDDIWPDRGQSCLRSIPLTISLMLAPRIFFLDSDDMLAPNALQVLMDQSIRTDADFTEGGICKFDDEGRRAKPKTHYILLNKH